MHNFSSNEPEMWKIVMFKMQENKRCINQHKNRTLFQTILIPNIREHSWVLWFWNYYNQIHQWIINGFGRPWRSLSGIHGCSFDQSSLGCHALKLRTNQQNDWEINFNYDFFFSDPLFFKEMGEKEMVQNCTAKVAKRIGDEQNEYMSNM